MPYAQQYLVTGDVSAADETLDRVPDSDPTPSWDGPDAHLLTSPNFIGDPDGTWVLTNFGVPIGTTTAWDGTGSRQFDSSNPPLSGPTVTAVADPPQPCGASSILLLDDPDARQHGRRG